MPSIAEWIRHGTEDAARVGYFVRQERARGPLPTVLLVHEAWGVNEHVQHLARRFADAGYAVLAPDLYAVDAGARPPVASPERLQELLTFADTVPPATLGNSEAHVRELQKVADSTLRQRLHETLEATFGPEGLRSRKAEYVAHLGEAVTYLRDECEHTHGRPVGVVGFGLGGDLAGALAAHDARVSAAVSFYGQPPPPEAAARIACPVLAFHAGSDAELNARVAPFAEAMRQAGKPFEHHVYERAAHAFHDDTRLTYDVSAARDAFARTLGFFAHQLVTERVTEPLGA